MFHLKPHVLRFSPQPIVTYLTYLGLGDYCNCYFRSSDFGTVPLSLVPCCSIIILPFLTPYTAENCFNFASASAVGPEVVNTPNNLKVKLFSLYSIQLLSSILIYMLTATWGKLLAFDLLPCYLANLAVLRT